MTHSQTVNLILQRTPTDFNNPTRKHDRWNVWAGKQLVVEGSKDPEHDACRELLKKGITGSAVFWHRGSTDPARKMGIEWGARYTVRETTNRGLVLERYEPFLSSDGPPKNRREGSGWYSPTLEAKRASTGRNDGGAS